MDINSLTAFLETPVPVWVLMSTIAAGWMTKIILKLRRKSLSNTQKYTYDVKGNVTSVITKY